MGMSFRCLCPEAHRVVGVFGDKLAPTGGMLREPAVKAVVCRLAEPMNAYELDILEVSGSASAMGQAQGEHWRERIQSFVGMRHTAMRAYGLERGRPHLEQQLTAVARTSMDVHQDWDAEGLEERRDTAAGAAGAAGAAADAVTLYAATQMTDMRDVVLLAESSGGHTVAADAEGCTSVMVLPGFSSNGHA